MTAHRPSNRKALILAAASQLFLDNGYHNVSMADVAGATGITPGALYYHYDSKQDLLLHAVLGGMAAVDELVTEAQTLEDALVALTDVAVGPKRLLAVWEREARYLDADQREVVRSREGAIAQRLTQLVLGERPELTGREAELVAWGLLGVFGSRSRHRLSLPRRRHAELMHHLGRITAQQDLGGAEDVMPSLPDLPGSGTTALRIPRRELLLAEAIRLFDERGYQSVTMADIGEAAGIVASGVYRHFPGKTDLIVAATNRGAEQMRVLGERVLSHSDSPEAAMEMLLEAHIALVLDESHLVGILAHEADELPDLERSALRRAQSEYLAVWVQLLDAVSPGHDTAELKVVIHAVHNLIYLVVRAGRAGSEPGIAEQLGTVGRNLLAGAWQPDLEPAATRSA